MTRAVADAPATDRLDGSLPAREAPPNGALPARGTPDAPANGGHPARLAPPNGSPTARETPPSGLYVHVPFCVSICPYCDFVVYAGRAARGPSNRVAAFVAALETELGLRADALDARWGRAGAGEHGGGRPPLETVYLGGGTPSLVPADAISRLLSLVRERFGIADGAEVSLEVNPGPDERGDAGAIRDAGVTRLSVGAQSFDPAELRLLGRRHAPGDIAATVAAGRAAGIGSISLDLLYDAPGGSLEAWERSLDAAVALEPDHLSLYALTLDDPDAEGITGVHGDHLPLRAGARRWRKREASRQDDDRAAAMYELADRRLAAAGYAWYEISNWARPGHESRHNLGYWRGRAWEAVGPGAHAFDGLTRRWNAARLDGYLDALAPLDGTQPGLPPGGGSPPLDAAAADREAAVVALRTAEGLPDQLLDRPDLGPALIWALGAGLLARTPAGRLVLSLRGRLLSNEVFARMV